MKMPPCLFEMGVAVALLVAATTAFATGDAPSVQQLMAAAPQQSLWQFLRALPSSMEAQVFAALLFSGVLGMVAHYFRKWLSGEISGSLIDYLFIQYPRRTAGSFCAYIGWIVSLVGTGVFTTSSGEFVGWGIVLLMGLSNGYSVDSLANKAQANTQGATS